MSENVETKARRYLSEGRLIVDHVSSEGVVATCRGGDTIYHMNWYPSTGWTCTCPARGVCAHLRALQLVTVRGGDAMKQDTGDR